MGLLVAFLQLELQVVTLLVNLLVVLALSYQNVVQLLDLLRHQLQILLVLQDLQVFLVRYLELVSVFLQLVVLRCHLVFKIVDDLFVFTHPPLQGLVLESLVQ